MATNDEFEKFNFMHRFLAVTSNLKTEILLNSKNDDDILPPDTLPNYIERYLTLHFSSDVNEIRHFWTAFRNVVWLSPALPLADDDIRLFQERGPTSSDQTKEQLTQVMFYPPMTKCPTCTSRLRKPKRFKATYFSLKHGALAAYTTSLSCQYSRCPDYGRRYHHNYSIGIDQMTNQKMRTYYNEHPQILQTDQHSFMDFSLCKYFSVSMRTQWASASNIAAVFNETIGDPGYERSSGWSYSLSADKVNHAFQLHALLLDSYERSEHISVLELGDATERLNVLIEQRNGRMKYEGDRYAREHVCDVCCIKVQGSGVDNIDRIDAVVTDGVTIGHPCCAVHNCEEPLRSKRDKFCPLHTEQSLLCAVINPPCNRPADPGFRTCSDPGHRVLDQQNNLRNKAWFQLRRRLERAGIMHASTSDFSAANDDIYAQEEDDITAKVDGSGLGEEGFLCTDKPATGNRKIRARWRRRQTHNEQLIIRPCGVIVARGTMYGSESVTNVVKLFKDTFRKDDLPCVIFYDNNCSLQKHLRAARDTYFARCIMPVDVFHFKSKHSIKDDFCQNHCNPLLWPVLYNEKTDSWVFNSSIAEQTNVWLNGFHPMLREMTALTYNFFLDEMIKQRNREVIAKLDKDGKRPFSGAHV